MCTFLTVWVLHVCAGSNVLVLAGYQKEHKGEGCCSSKLEPDICVLTIPAVQPVQIQFRQQHAQCLPAPVTSILPPQLRTLGALGDAVASLGHDADPSRVVAVGSIVTDVHLLQVFLKATV